MDSKLKFIYKKVLPRNPRSDAPASECFREIHPRSDAPASECFREIHPRSDAPASECFGERESLFQTGVYRIVLLNLRRRRRFVCVLRQFANVHGGSSVCSGSLPMVTDVRLSVPAVCQWSQTIVCLLRQFAEGHGHSSVCSVASIFEVFLNLILIVVEFSFVHYWLRWINTRGEVGPWSETISVTISA
jgi:hypothetical protein